jgi:hypothetical protein
MGEAAQMNKLFTQFGKPPADRSRVTAGPDDRASDALENIRCAKTNSDIVQQKGSCIPVNQFLGLPSVQVPLIGFRIVPLCTSGSGLGI